MIPKKIHYVWPGRDEKSKLFKECFQSWQKTLPEDWEFIEWNPDTFNFEEHRKNNKFFDIVCEKNLYAFCSDYIRTVVLYEYGGIYLDTDVTLLKPFSDTMLDNKMILPLQNGILVEPAIWGAEAKHPFTKKILEFYNNEIWNTPEYMLPDIFMKYLAQEYHIYRFEENRHKQKISKTDNGEITFYPERYFIPFRAGEHYKPDCIQDETIAIHWFNENWTNNDSLEFLQTKHIKKVSPKIQLFRKYFGLKFDTKRINIWIKLFGKKFIILNRVDI